MRKRKVCCLCHHDLMDAFDLNESDAREIVADPELAEMAKGMVESRWASEASLAATQQALESLHNAIYR